MSRVQVRPDYGFRIRNETRVRIAIRVRSTDRLVDRYCAVMATEASQRHSARCMLARIESRAVVWREIGLAGLVDPQRYNLGGIRVVRSMTWTANAVSTGPGTTVSAIGGREIVGRSLNTFRSSTP